LWIHKWKPWNKVHLTFQVSNWCLDSVCQKKGWLLLNVCQILWT
jgi:hypothetical protein